MVDVVAPEHERAARRFKQIYATYRQNKDLINVGAYQAGSDMRVDEAIAMHPRLSGFLQQHMRERVGWNDSLAGLAAALGVAPEASRAAGG
jgi:flagellum-specific ATP synthase